MANLTIVPGEVSRVYGETRKGRCGTTISAGMPCWENEDGDYFPGDADQTSRESARDIVIALGSGTVGSEITFQEDGVIKLGATANPAKGTTYNLGATPGAWAPNADVATNWWVVELGIANGQDYQILLNVQDYGGIQKA